MDVEDPLPLLQPRIAATHKPTRHARPSSVAPAWPGPPMRACALEFRIGVLRLRYVARSLAPALHVRMPCLHISSRARAQAARCSCPPLRRQAPSVEVLRQRRIISQRQPFLSLTESNRGECEFPERFKNTSPKAKHGGAQLPLPLPPPPFLCAPMMSSSSQCLFPWPAEEPERAFVREPSSDPLGCIR